MRILILTAMHKEWELVSRLINEPTLLPSYDETDDNKVLSGSVGKNQIILAKCGIGKVNAALNTFLLIQKYHPDLVINTGVAGGINAPIGTMLLADKVCYHDVWCGPGTVTGQADGLPLYMIPSLNLINDLKSDSSLVNNFITGLICSGDRFISKPEEVKEIRELYPEAKAVDMESAAVAHACMMTKTPFLIIRIVSDTPGEGENIEQYKDFWTKAPEKTFSLIKEIISVC